MSTLVAEPQQLAKRHQRGALMDEDLERGYRPG